MPDQGPVAVDQLAAAKARLEPFLQAHPNSTVSEALVGGEAKVAVQNPWGDNSIAFTIPADDDLFYDALNSVLLPERFTALYHKELKSLEVIWTAYKLPERQKEIIGRKFKFNYSGNSHNCHFGKSSDKLLKLSEYVVPIRVSATSFRNMMSFRSYAFQHKDQSYKNASISDPVSFWIDGLEWNTDYAVEMINNLNFYLQYYDNESPTVILHQVDDVKLIPRLRYISGKFPKTISGKKLDNNLLSFWDASQAGDAARQFQYYYRIIEYASFFYLESSSRIAVKRVLSSPDAIDDITTTTEKLMSAFQMSKLDEYAKFSSLLHDTLDVKLLWCEVKENIPAFSKDFKFDGGFNLKAIISPTTKESAFSPKGVEVFTKAIRDIRNALSHGRDFKTAAVIVPSARNFKALQPWVHLISVAAGQVVLFKDIA